MRFQPGIARDVAAIGSLAGIVLLSGCTLLEPPRSASTPSDTPETHPRSGPVDVLETTAGFPPEFPNFPGSADAEAGLAYVNSEDPTVLMLMTYGSSSCPYLPISYEMTSAGRLTLVVDEDVSEAVPYEDTYMCTADLAESNSVFSLPSHVEVPDEVTIEEVGDGTLSVTVPVWDAPAECAAVPRTGLWCQWMQHR